MTFKKLLLFVMLVTNIHAQENIAQVNFVLKEQTGTYLVFESEHREKAWIGLYKKGTSNDWENVLSWSWVTSNITKLTQISHLQADNYEARLFFNNSFITAASIDIIIGDNPGNNQHTVLDSYASPYSKKFTVNLSYDPFRNVTDWVSIFEKGAIRKRENLLAWGYIDVDKKIVQMTSLQPKKLKLGTYDIVYFNNDTYQQSGPTAILTIRINMYHGQFRGTFNNKDVLIIDDYDSVKKANDWVAIFHKDAQPIRENIIHWAYVKEAEILNNPFPSKGTALYFSKFPHIADSFNYKIMLFSDDSYKVLSSTTLNGADD